MTISTATSVVAAAPATPSACPTEGAVTIIDQVAELRARVAAARRQGQRIAFVPTMGALHDGHLSLVREAKHHGELVVASIFVNPAQFGPDEDLASYPRDPAGDAALLAAAGCDVLFLPSAETVYPDGHSTWVEVIGPDQGFEGAERPGHFRGVATVVLALFHIVQPDVAVFGRKDAQQLAVVRKLVRDLHVPVQVVAAPIVREDDGLAMSSRNVYLDAAQRRGARVLHRSLRSVEERLRCERLDPEAVRAHVAEQVATEPLAQLDYVAVVGAVGFQPLEVLQGEVVIALAVRFGSTRLLDNLHLHLDAAERR